jgi:hypothetical protein
MSATTMAEPAFLRLPSPEMRGIGNAGGVAVLSDVDLSSSPAR